MENIFEIIFAIYMFLGYLSIPHTLWRNHVVWGDEVAVFGRRAAMGALFGWFTIPWWLFFSRK